jgi:hypothetical protein
MTVASTVSVAEEATAHAIVSEDERFLFDLQGYLHLRAAISPAEIDSWTRWATACEGTDMVAYNADRPEANQYLNRPVSRIIDVEPRFGCLLDHPAVERYLAELLGHDYRHIDNDLFYTPPGTPAGGWHRGSRAHPTGHVRDGRFICPMVKIFFCITDVGPDQGAFAVVPGSHRARFEIPTDRLDLPGQHIFDDVKAGDIIIFNEGLLHHGRPNRTERARKTLIVNFGRVDCGVWLGYEPASATLERLTPRQREIFGANRAKRWEPEGDI